MSAHEYESLAKLARDRARHAMHQGNPESAQEWIAAATAAEQAKIEPVITNHLSAIVGLLEQLDITIANGLTALAGD